jgi:hypothetical protein
MLQRVRSQGLSHLFIPVFITSIANSVSPGPISVALGTLESDIAGLVRDMNKANETLKKLKVREQIIEIHQNNE